MGNQDRRSNVAASAGDSVAVPPGKGRQETEAAATARQEQVAEMHRQLRQIKKLEDENRELRVRLHANEHLGRESDEGSRNPGEGARQASREPEDSGATAGALFNSVRYRVGDAFVSAITSPGREMLKLPVRLFRLFREGLARRRGHRVPLRGHDVSYNGRHTSIAVRNSVRYRVGDILVKAVTSPGRNTFAVPVRLYRVYRQAKARQHGRT